MGMVAVRQVSLLAAVVREASPPAGLCRRESYGVAVDIPGIDQIQSQRPTNCQLLRSCTYSRDNHTSASGLLILKRNAPQQPAIVYLPRNGVSDTDTSASIPWFRRRISMDFFRSCFSGEVLQ